MAALRATYLASAVDSATVACFLLRQLTAPLANKPFQNSQGTGRVSNFNQSII